MTGRVREESWVFESLWCVCLTLLHLRALTHRDPTQKYLINLSLRVSNGLVLFWWTLTTWTMPYLGLNVTAFYLWKRWLYSFKVLLGIEAASNQLYKLTPANHQTYQGDVGPSSDYWEGFTKGLGYRHLWHLVKKNKKKTLQTCHCIVITYFCCDYVASYPRFPSAGVGLSETKPDLAVRYCI